MDDDRRYLRMQLRMPSLGTRNSVAFMKAVEPQLRERFPTPPGGIKTQINGIDILLSDVIEALGVQLYIGFAFAALVITLVMSFVYNSWRVGLASMMPNILPVISGIGILGLIGLKIDIDALFMVSIALGIAVDDTIHFLTRYKLERTAGLDKDEAIRLSLHETGVGIVRTSIILVMGFGVFLFSPYLTFKYVGLILPTTMLMAVIADMLVIPAMVYLNWIPVVSGEGLRCSSLTVTSWSQAADRARAPRLYPAADRSGSAGSHRQRRRIRRAPSRRRFRRASDETLNPSSLLAAISSSGPGGSAIVSNVATRSRRWRAS